MEYVLNRVMNFGMGLFIMYAMSYIFYPLFIICWYDAVNYPTYKYIDVGPEHFQWFLLALVSVAGILMALIMTSCFLTALFGKSIYESTGDA